MQPARSTPWVEPSTNGTAAATARPTVNRFPVFEAATPTIEASTNAVTETSNVIGSLSASSALGDGGVVKWLVFADALRTISPFVAEDNAIAKRWVRKFNPDADEDAARHDETPVEGDKNDAPAMMKTPKDGNRVVDIEAESPDKVYLILVPGFTVMFVFFLINIMARSFIAERDQGTLRRLRLAPVTNASILIGKTLPFYLMFGLAGVPAVCLRPAAVQDVVGAGADLFDSRDPLHVAGGHVARPAVGDTRPHRSASLGVWNVAGAGARRHQRLPVSAGLAPGGDAADQPGHAARLVAGSLRRRADAVVGSRHAGLGLLRDAGGVRLVLFPVRLVVLPHDDVRRRVRTGCRRGRSGRRTRRIPAPATCNRPAGRRPNRLQCIS